MTSFARPGSGGMTSTVWNKNNFSSLERRNFNRTISSPYSKSWCSSTTDQDDNLSKSSIVSQKRKRYSRSGSSCSNSSVLTEDNSVMISELDRRHIFDSSNVNRYSDLIDKDDDSSSSDEQHRNVMRRRMASHTEFRDSPNSLPSVDRSSYSYATSHNVITSHTPAGMSKSHVISSSGSPSNSSPSDVFSSYRGLSSLRINTNSCATVDPHDDQDAAKLSSTHLKTFKTLLKDSSSSSCFASSSGSGKTSLAASSCSSRKSMSGSSSGGGMDSYCSLSSLDSFGSPSSPSSKSVAVVPVNYNEEQQDQYGRVRRRPDHNSRYNGRNKSHSRRRSRSSSRPYSSHRSSAKTSKTSTSGKTYTQSYVDLPLEWWERSEGCKEAKLDHMDRVDNLCSSREELVLLTTLWRDDIVLEPNMFPCK